MPENVKHSKADIYKFLKRTFFAVLSYNNTDDDGNMLITSELMIFNTTEQGDFYLTLKKPNSFFSSISDNPQVTLLIYKEEEDLEDIKRVIIQGEASIIEDFTSSEAYNAFKIIGEKTPLVRHLSYEGKEEKEKYCLIHVKSKVINYVSMEDVINNIEPTVLAKR